MPDIKYTYTVDIRNVLIIILIGICIFIYFNPLNSKDVSDLEKDNADKQNQINKISAEIDSIKNARKQIDLDIIKYKELSNLRKDTIKMLKKVSSNKESEIRDLKDDLHTYNDMLKAKEKQIDDLLKNPIILPKNKILDKITEKI